MDNLSTMQCVACRSDSPSLSREEITRFQPQIPEWNVIEREGVRRLQRVYKFRNFAEALVFTEVVGKLAESEGHHPVLKTEWGQVTVTWWTHKIKGLHQNDFIMAGKTDRLYTGLL